MGYIITGESMKTEPANLVIFNYFDYREYLADVFDLFKKKAAWVFIPEFFA